MLSEGKYGRTTSNEKAVQIKNGMFSIFAKRGMF
jgi:hypothetical protein